MKKRVLLMSFFAIQMSNLFANSNPSMSRVRGAQFTPQITVTQPAGSIGALNNTFGSGGKLNINTQLPGSQSRAIQVLSDGSILTALSKASSDSIIAKYNAEGTIFPTASGSTGFGVSGIADLGAATENAQVMILDVQGRILVAGGALSGTSGWLKRVASDGTGTPTTFNGAVTWQYIAALAEQSSGYIIAAGFDGAHAQIVRYKLSGILDTAFGTSGIVVLNGSSSGSATLPTVTSGLYNVVVDTNNYIYVAYKDATGGATHVMRLTAQGSLDLTWGTQGIANISYLNNATSPLFMAMDLHNNLIITAQVTASILVTAIQSSNGGSASPTFNNFTMSDAGHTLNVSGIITTSDGATGKVVIFGSNNIGTGIVNEVIRLTSSGVLDTTFNGTGYNQYFYNISTATCQITGMSVAPNGQLFTSGYQLNGSIYTPYLSCFYNNEYVYQVPQSPETQEQGILDSSFGSTTSETFAGIVSPYVGLYRTSLQQQAQAVIELISGNILIGMSGLTNTTDLTSMMLVRLTSQGILDTTFGFGGKLVLTNITGTNEHLNNIFEDGDGNLYVTGYSANGAIFRKYTSGGTLIWSSDYNHSGFQGLAIEFVGAVRVILFLSGPGTTGQINAYNIATGAIDEFFNPSGASPGSILTTDFGLDMGPLTSGFIDATGHIYIAYKNTSTGYINVAGFTNSGSSLLDTFGSSGVVSNVFSTTAITAKNISISFNNEENIIVAASAGTTYYITLLNSADGSFNSVFNNGTPLLINVPGSTSLQLSLLIGISDGSFNFVGYDNASDDTILVVRVASTGDLDVNFNSQGITPGILPIKIGDQLPDYYARVGTGITVQSHVGINQGNLIVSGYEQLFSNDAMPISMRVFGQPGTTQVKNTNIPTRIPGALDSSYGTGGIAQTYALGESSPTANQEVRAIRELNGTQIMTIITDNTTSISYTERLNADSSIDTTYGSGLGIAIVKLPGTEVVQRMVFDGSENFLVTGSNSLYGGYIKRILPTGAMDTTFGGPTGSEASANYPVGTVYGLMTSINACQQLNNGNIVVAGNTDGIGTIKMIDSTGVLITSTFGTGGVVTNGANITSVSVDPSNNIYASVGYLDVDSILKVRIIKLDQNGVYVSSFGSGGSIDAVISNINDVDSIRLVFDSSLRPIVAAAIGGNEGEFGIRRFNADGSVDYTFNGGSQTTITFTNPGQVFITGMASLQDDKSLVSGYQYDANTNANNIDFIGCVDAIGHPDGDVGSGGFAQGLTIFQAPGGVQLQRNLIDMNIQTNGDILTCGGDVPLVDEETPLTFRCYGFPSTQAVPQFTGYQSNLPTVLNYEFNQTGISTTPPIANLVKVGGIATTNLGSPVIAGFTTDNTFVVARYLRNGLLDTAFGVQGIATSSVISSIIDGASVAIDSIGNVLVGGITSSQQFVVVKFTDAGIPDSTFGIGGIARSLSVTNLAAGGFLAIDTVNRPLVAGYTTDGKIAATRFTSSGGTDSFGTLGIASTSISGLLKTGGITTDIVNNVYIGGVTSSGVMFTAMFTQAGALNTAYAGTGVAYAPAITGLTQGGSIAIDTNTNIVMGGLTPSQTFVVVRFTPTGSLDQAFNATSTHQGVAYSSPVNVLDLFGSVAIDSTNRIVLGGLALNYDDTYSCIVARFSPQGILDNKFTLGGLATTNGISGLTGNGGFVATDVYDNVFIGGKTDTPAFVVAEMLSGEEIFISDPSLLSSKELKVFYFGNNPDFMYKVLAAEFFARVIKDPIVRAAVLIQVNAVLAEFVLIYENAPGWSLVWHLYRNIQSFTEIEALTVGLYVGSATDITSFFNALTARALAVQYSVE